MKRTGKERRNDRKAVPEETEVTAVHIPEARDSYGALRKLDGECTEEPVRRKK